MEDKLTARGYHKKALERYKGEIMSQTVKKIPKKGDRLAFVSCYNVLSKDVGKIINRHWDILKVACQGIPAKERIREHKSDIQQNPVACHFIDVGHSISQLRFQILQQVTRPRRGGDRVKQLLKCEANWIRNLGTLMPGGLNKEYELYPLL
ncbi:hypothetical protein XELAEV_18029981mg [Xenopus laevis]|uniref:Uncharacterized protein n=1 Tax=Xenopus laevis TaxID=8355 RepID=A0A974CUE7_XENLA|nr:hypothetical protein XELAEV_18029981mg [Xenopus laevis]